MKNRTKFSNIIFRSGDLYLFNKHNSRCPSCSSILGIYNKTLDNDIYLECSTVDLLNFRLWHKLNSKYYYVC